MSKSNVTSSFMPPSGQGVNPSSPSIHIQILQTDLHTFPYGIS